MFTKNLRRRRRAAELTQEWMGDYLKITQGSYNQIERGTKQPSIPIIEALTQLFNCTADELLFGEGTAVEGGETAK